MRPPAKSSTALVPMAINVGVVSPVAIIVGTGVRGVYGLAVGPGC